MAELGTSTLTLPDQNNWNINLQNLLGDQAIVGDQNLPKGTAVNSTLDTVTQDELVNNPTVNPGGQNVGNTATGTSTQAQVTGNRNTSTVNPFLNNGNAAQGTAAQISQDQIDQNKMEAAQGTVDPNALIQNQFNDLSKVKDENGVPVWASDAVKNVNETMAARGLGNSSITADATAHAVMTSLFPYAQFNAQQYQQMSLVNLNNQQQANLVNSQNKMQATLANLSASQQQEIQNTQMKQQSLLSDQSFANAAAQFNATSENQTKQFFANLATNVAVSNATRADAMSQFNAGQTNAIAEFNANLTDQRERFNTQNQMIIDQSNANWRRQVNTANTAAINAAQQTNAQNLLNRSNWAMSQLWQQSRDEASWAFTSGENAKDRSTSLAMAALNNQSIKDQLSTQLNAGFMQTLGQFGVNLLNKVV